MTTLTRIRLRHGPLTDPTLADPERLHAAAAAIGHAGEGRVLHRLDDDGTLWLVSPATPDPDDIRARLDADAIDSTGYDRFLERLAPGRIHRFEIECNPTASRRPEPGVPTRRVPLTGREDRLAWLERTLAAHGMTVLNADTGEGRTLDFAHHGGRVRLTAVPAAGVLRIDDPKAAADALRRGVGRGRAYGMGLLLLG